MAKLALGPESKFGLFFLGLPILVADVLSRWSELFLHLKCSIGMQIRHLG